MIGVASKALAVLAAVVPHPDAHKHHIAWRTALGSEYGDGTDGQLGNPLACGGHLQAGQLGVAHKTLPCGTRVRFHTRARTLIVRVIDRGPYAGGRSFDLTSATARKLRLAHPWSGAINWSFAPNGR